MRNAFLLIFTFNARKLYEIELYFLVQWQLVPNISHMLHSLVASEAVKSCNSYFSAFLLPNFAKMLTVNQFPVVGLCYLSIQFAQLQSELNLDHIDERQVSPHCQ